MSDQHFFVIFCVIVNMAACLQVIKLGPLSKYSITRTLLCNVHVLSQLPLFQYRIESKKNKTYENILSNFVKLFLKVIFF